MAVTTNYSWTKPTVGASTNTWGTELNGTLDGIDTSVFAVSGVANAALARAGGTMTGALVLSGAPTVDLHAATKLYVDTADALKANLASPTFTGTATFARARCASVTDASAAGVLTIDLADSNVFKVALTENVTTLTLQNASDGQTINVRFTQDATGGRTMSWPAAFKWQGGSAATLSTAASAVDLLVATYYADTGFWYADLNKGYA